MSSSSGVIKFNKGSRHYKFLELLVRGDFPPYRAENISQAARLSVELAESVVKERADSRGSQP